MALQKPTTIKTKGSDRFATKIISLFDIPYFQAFQIKAYQSKCLLAHTFYHQISLFLQGEVMESWLVLQWSWHMDVLSCISKSFGHWGASLIEGVGEGG